MRSTQQGQALVEAALVLPALIVLLLCTVQLALLQQARVLVEWAASSAARVGIVHDGDNGTSGADGAMHDAAVIALLPSVSRTDSFAALAAGLVKFRAREAVLSPLGLAAVRVFVWSPRRADFATFGQHLHGEELDFDDVRPAAADATQLSIQVRYLFELRVPFANRLLQAIWLASHAGLLPTLRGFNAAAPRIGNERGTDGVTAAQVAAMGVRVQDGTPEGIPLAALVAAARAGHPVLPVEAFATQRMQSNPFRKWARP